MYQNSLNHSKYSKRLRYKRQANNFAAWILFRFCYVPETFDEPELIEYKLVDWATRTPAAAEVPGAYFWIDINIIENV